MLEFPIGNGLHVEPEFLPVGQILAVRPSSCGLS